MKYIFTILCILSISCNKNDSEGPIPKTPNDSPDSIIVYQDVNEFAKLEVGNYWVYQRVTVDRITKEEYVTNNIDSISVIRESIIEGKKYYNLVGKWFGLNFNRLIHVDSFDLLAPGGRKYFSFNTKELRKIPNVNNEMIDSIRDYMTFDTIQVSGIDNTYKSEYQYRRRFHLNECCTFDSCNVRPEDEYYAYGIGVVKYTSFYGSGCRDVEMRLIRYHLN